MINDVELGQPYHLTADGGLSLDFHTGQWDAWDSMRRFVFVLAGTQGGKTSFGPLWQHREIYHPEIGRGGGDHIAVTGSYDLFKLKMLPALRELFESTTRQGRYWSGDKIIELRDPTKNWSENPRGGTFWAKRSDDPMWGRIILRSAESGSGLESSTAKSAWLDECGMDSFTAETYRSIRRRLSLYRGRILGTTTLYVLYNWLKKLYDEWINGRKDVDFIQFSSLLNPSFPKEEYEAALAEMPEHVINMQYRGMYDKPPGMIYDSFNSELCVIPPFAVPDDWPSYGGMDYGGVNTVCGCIRQNPANDIYYLTREYHEGGRTAVQHTRDLSDWNCRLWFGGAKSEGQWRDEFRAAGIPVREPKVSDVWLGINRVYAVMKKNRLMVFDTCEKTLGQIGSYSRKMNKSTGEPIEDQIANKDEYHYLDMLRYVIGSLEDITPPPAGGAADDIDLSVYRTQRRPGLFDRRQG
jgi:hypothetical protein